MELREAERTHRGTPCLLLAGIAHYATLALTLASPPLMPSRPSCGEQDPVQRCLGPEVRLHWFPGGSLPLPAPWPAALSTPRFFGGGREAPSFPQPHPLAGQCPCLPRHHAQPLAAETQDPIDSLPLFYDITWGGRGERRGACGGSLRGLNKPSMSWEVPDAKLRGCLASMCSVWMPLFQRGPQNCPSVCPGGRTADGKKQPEGRRGDKGRAGGWRESPWCPLSALHALCEALGEDATLPLSSCPDRAWLCGASSEKGRQTGRGRGTGRSLESRLLPALVQGLGAMLGLGFPPHSHDSLFPGPAGDGSR